jgi:hypothetical protein
MRTADSWNVGNILRKSPSANRIIVRLRSLNINAEFRMVFSSCFANEKTMETPTMKRKDGKTESAKVHPFQATWLKCE